jgi:hypothetical protein
MKDRSLRNTLWAWALLTALSASVGWAQTPAAEREYYRYYHKTKIALAVSTEKIAVVFDDPATETQRQGIASDAAVARLGECRDARNRVQMVELKPGLSRVEVEVLVQRAAERPGVRFATPVLQTDGGGSFVPDGGVIVQFAKDATDAEIAALNGRYGATVQRKFPGRTPRDDTKEYVLRVSDPKRNTPLDVANRYAGNPRVLWAEPDGYELTLKACAVTPSDTYFPYGNDPNHLDRYQWSLKQNGTGDHDIDADEAWDTQTGSSDIVIAVLDTGCYLSHPDLNFWTNTGEVAGNGVDDDGNGYVDDVHGRDFYNGDGNPNVNGGSNHGTACAGISSAIGNNGTGITGICWGARVMAVKVFDDVGNPGDYSSIALAIHYAADNGADVLSCSWSAEALGTLSVAVDQAIAAAKSGGRGGRGCPVVFSSGNNDCGAAWPSHNKEVIAVGAVGADGYREGYSNYGNWLDLVAPSGDKNEGTGIWTTFSYTATYPSHPLAPLMYDLFHGTSAACPHVVGVAALLIAQDPTLTANEIQALLEFSSVEEDSPYLPRRDPFYGYGYVNAKQALNLAREPRTQFYGANGTHVASFYTQSGHLVVNSLVDDYASSENLTPDASDIWVLRNNDTTVVARLTADGELYLKDDWREQETDLEPPSNSPLLICSDSGALVAYIDDDGRMRLKGRIFMGDDPDRDSSQDH